MPSTSRKCSVCAQQKPDEAYGWNRSRPTRECDECRAARLKLQAEYRAAYRVAKPESVRASNLWRLYRIRPAEYDAMRVAQDYRCAICGTHEDNISTARVGGRPRLDGAEPIVAALQVDHCHKDPAAPVRGLLCGDCNRGIGHFQEDPDRLLAAVEYVRRFRR